MVALIRFDIGALKTNTCLLCISLLDPQMLLDLLPVSSLIDKSSKTVIRLNFNDAFVGGDRAGPSASNRRYEENIAQVELPPALMPQSPPYGSKIPCKVHWYIYVIELVFLSYIINGIFFFIFQGSGLSFAY